MGLLLLGAASMIGVVFVQARNEQVHVEWQTTRAEVEARQAELAERERESGVTLLLGASSGDRSQVEATAEVLRERLRLSGIKGEVGVRADLRLQVHLPGDGVESAIDLLLAGGDLQFKIVSTLTGEEREAALKFVEEAKKAGTWDVDTDRHDIGHTPEGEPVLLENPGVPGYLLTKVYKAKDANGKPAIGFEFGQQGQRRFGDLTGSNLKRNLAIVLDGVVNDTPTILARIEKAGIINNPGGFETSVQERLITVLQSGKLPVDLDLESQTTREK